MEPIILSHRTRALVRAATFATVIATSAACGDSPDGAHDEGVDAEGMDADDDPENLGARSTRPTITSIFGRSRSGTENKPRAPTTARPPTTTRPPTTRQPVTPSSGLRGDFYVSPAGSDSAQGTKENPWKTIQAAVKKVAAGRIIVRGGNYAERLIIQHAGTSDADMLSLVAAPGEQVSLLGEGAGKGENGNMIYLEGASYVRIEGFRIVGAGKQSDASGIRLMDTGHHIEIVNNEISNIRGESAMGITVYGKDGVGINDIKVRGNHIHDCEPAPSEALVINGNVKRFEISENKVHDVNNIGIDIIGGEAWLSRAYPEDGLIARNVVTRANSSYDGSAACIYVDGASRLTLEQNTVSECDFGIEIGAENRGTVVRDVVVRNNFVFRNYRGGIIFGGYDSGRGRVRASRFVHNSLYKNGRPGEKTRHGYVGSANGEIIVQYADDCELSNNILYGVRQSAETVASWGKSSGMRWLRNLHFREGGGVRPPKETGSLLADPRFVNPDSGDLHLRVDSPARDVVNADQFAGTVDIDGQPRAVGKADIGADEH
jgi:parallel beta-helix repeat protein